MAKNTVLLFQDYLIARDVEYFFEEHEGVEWELKGYEGMTISEVIIEITDINTRCVLNSITRLFAHEEFSSYVDIRDIYYEVEKMVKLFVMDYMIKHNYIV